MPDWRFGAMRPSKHAFLFQTELTKWTNRFGKICCGRFCRFCRKSLPNSHKVYVSGKLHPDIRVPFSAKSRWRPTNP